MTSGTVTPIIFCSMAHIVKLPAIWHPSKRLAEDRMFQVREFRARALWERPTQA
jgi:hypothetical protein